MADSWPTQYWPLTYPYWPVTYPYWPTYTEPAAPIPSTDARPFRVFDRYGKPLAELDVDVDSVTWRLNKTGFAKIRIAKTVPKAIRDYLRFYNRILLQFSNGLPDWGGILTPSRDWGDGEIVLSSYDAAEILEGRITNASRSFNQTPAGTIYQTLIEEANAILDTGLDIGTVWTGGSLRSPATYHYARLMTKINDLSVLTGNDFAFVPYLTAGGRLRWWAHWYERRGSDKPDVALIEGHNVQVLKFTEVGPITNVWATYGDGATWTDKPKYSISDAASISEYGRLENSRSFTGVVNSDTLEENTDELLRETKQPRNRFSLRAIDRAPAQFADYDIGDRIKLQLHTFGFSGATFGYDAMIRILERSYSPTLGLCDLVVEEYVE